MVKIRKYANFIERFLHGERGQRFFNFAYSIGAAIVIWGALFKILHLPGGSTLLCIGMGTEIAMFLLTAFDRPPKDYHWEEVFPVLDSRDPDDRPDFASGEGIPAGMASAPRQGSSNGAYTAAPDPDGPQVITVGAPAPSPAVSLADATASDPDTLASLHDNIVAVAAQMEQLRETTRRLNEVSAVLLQSYQAITDNSDAISDSATGYADRMSDLNRNISGLNTIYEIQLKSVAGQLESIERVNRGLKDLRDMYEKSANESSRYCEETERMARYMRQLNAVYEKMITAMTINMHNPMMGAPTTPFPGSTPSDNP
ncbi:MAG: gliding motility protein GldL [Muribaculaceae bacterium]|nr:gliding motility protein GldL [Muribaculaceae bacterium]